MKIRCTEYYGRAWRRNIGSGRQRRTEKNGDSQRAETSSGDYRKSEKTSAPSNRRMVRESKSAGSTSQRRSLDVTSAPLLTAPALLLGGCSRCVTSCGGRQCQAAAEAADIVRQLHAALSSPYTSRGSVQMENPPLASLSLTHVHYVCTSLPPAAATLTLQEPRRPHLVPLRVAGTRAAGIVRRVRDADMVEPRG